MIRSAPPSRSTARSRSTRANFLDTRRTWGASAPDPIFVLGMPRSGSTLVEQILASHPLVEGTQELGDIQMMAARIGEESKPILEALAGFAPARFAEIGEEYLSRTRAHRHTDRPLFIDKMPNNWLHAGFIQPDPAQREDHRYPAPSARVLLFQLQAALRARASVRLRPRPSRALLCGLCPADGRTSMPSRPARSTACGTRRCWPSRKRRSAHCSTSPACRSTRHACGSTRTSVQCAPPAPKQVRRPINRDGVGQWRNYDEHLEPLRAALGRHVASYPHPAD